MQDTTSMTIGDNWAVTSLIDTTDFISGVTAGNGLTGGGTSGTVTLNVGAGTGIIANANDISVDVAGFMLNGSDNRVVTASGADTMNAEANLTFDGSTLTAPNFNGNLSGTVSTNWVSIRVSSPNFPLEVAGTGQNKLYAMLRIYNHGTHNSWYTAGFNWQTSDVSARFHDGLISYRLYIMSDERIKKNIIDIDDEEALILLRLIEPKKYKYINEYGNDNYTYGFIAQQVKTVIDEAVTLDTNYIPNIMKFATISNIENTTSVLTLEEEHNLVINDKIKCLGPTRDEITDIIILEVIDSKTFKFV
jgi:hypothetical protein